MTFTAVQSVDGTLVASTATAITFGTGTTPIKYTAINVINTAATGVIFARADGTAATLSGDGCEPVEPGATVTFENGDPYWTQAATVIPVGIMTGQVPGRGTPHEIQPYGSSLYGGLASPGTTVSLISSVTPTYTVEGID
jgi:hypothetical protein